MTKLPLYPHFVPDQLGHYNALTDESLDAIYREMMENEDISAPSCVPDDETLPLHSPLECPDKRASARTSSTSG
jgi:hypothetical protein